MQILAYFTKANLFLEGCSSQFQYQSVSADEKITNTLQPAPKRPHLQLSEQTKLTRVYCLMQSVTHSLVTPES